MNYEELVKALRCKRDDCEGCDLAFFDNDEGWMCQYAAKDDDAADAIEALQDEVKRLKECNDELREKQTFIDNWGTRWMTSAKDVPDSAYKHGYADGKYEALTLERCIDRLHELGWLQEHDRILTEPKRGEMYFLEYDNPETGEYEQTYFQCSVCGKYFYGVDEYEAKHFNYCPNCGARMEVQDGK